MNRRALQKLADARLLGSRALLKAKRYDAAHYFAGYVIECALKACIARKTLRYDFPRRDARNLYTHELELLLKEAGIERSFQEDRRNDPTLDGYWGVVKDWKPDDVRYDLRGVSAAHTAKAFLSAIEDRQHGVLQCLSKYW